MPNHHYLCYSIHFLLTFLFLSVLINTAYALNDVVSLDHEALPTESKLSTQAINAELQKLDADNSMSPVNKKTIQQLYQRALEKLQEVSVFEATTHSYHQQIQESDKNIIKIKQQLSQLVAHNKKPSVAEKDQLAIAKLEHQLQTDKARLITLQNALDGFNQDIQQLIDRPNQIYIALQTLANKVMEIEKHLHDLSPADYDDYTLYTAETIAIQANRLSLRAENKTLAMELNSQPHRLELMKVRYDFAIAEIASLRSYLDWAENYLIGHRETEASRFSREMAEALEAAAGKHPILIDAIRENITLGNEYRQVSHAMTIALTKHDQVERQEQEIKTQFKKAERLLSLSDISPKLALLLREQRQLLLANGGNKNRIVHQLNQRGDANLRQFEVEESLKALDDINKVVNEKLNIHLTDSDSEHERMPTGIELSLLLNQQKLQLEKLNKVYTDYLGTLEKLNYSSQQLNETSRFYQSYLDKNLLWVKSAEPISLNFVDSLGGAMAWLLSFKQWNKALGSLYPAANQQFIWTSLILIIVLGLLLSRSTIQRRQQAIIKQVGFGYSDKFSYTLESMLLIILQVIPMVLIVLYIGWLFKTSEGSSQFEQALGHGLIVASIPLFFLQCFYLFFAPQGIACNHLKWQMQSVALIRRQIFWIRYVGVACLFVIALTNNQNMSIYSDSLGRVALILILIVISTALAVTLRPDTGALKRYYKNHPHSIFSKTRYVWYPVVVIAPLVVAVFAGIGYLASAVELQQRIIASMRLILIAIILNEFALRGLRLFNRDLAVKKYLQKKQPAESQKTSGELGETTLPSNPDELDISTINKQTRRLLALTVVATVLIGLWWVWKDLIPALGILDDLELWKKSVLVDNVITFQSVTLANLFLALFYIVIVIVAIKNLPGVLEVLILNRLSMNTGSRFAAIQLINYSLIALAVVMVASELGGQWSQVQWLVAALGVGLGFGLQEIFANFVSGIILLFERPIRIGDTVTVGDVTGTVSRIQIRATTITDWDRKDLVVPNKNFITDQLVNWTRTDSITRIIINVGIAYGSETKLAHQVIADILKDHPMVLSEPQPMVFFTGFGDSSLDFEIRLFVNDVINRLPLTHDIHMKIDEEFHKHGIEIPFPQRDIHIRSGGNI